MKKLVLLFIVCSFWSACDFSMNFSNAGTPHYSPDCDAGYAYYFAQIFVYESLTSTPIDSVSCSPTRFTGDRYTNDSGWVQVKVYICAYDDTLTDLVVFQKSANRTCMLERLFSQDENSPPLNRTYLVKE